MVAFNKVLAMVFFKTCVIRLELSVSASTTVLGPVVGFWGGGEGPDEYFMMNRT